MNIKDRTSEFQRSVVSYKKLYKVGNQDAGNKARNNPSSEFQRNASVIAKEISDTAQLLSKLAILAKRKPMFNDNPVEIAELSFLIKRKIYSIEQQLIKLNQITRNNNTGGNNSVNTKSHSSNVINLLNKKMKNISGDFKSVLEERQKLELINKDRWVKITENTTESAFDTPEPVDNNTSTNDGHLHEQKDVIGYNSSNPFMSSLIDETENINSNTKLILPNSESQLLLMEEGMQDNVYLQERNRAVETIESTIQEVGNLFQQLASMVQEQGEVIQRIDANVDDVDLNISAAQRELLKYFDRIKSNRWLAVKIFFIIFVFFLIWVLVN
ncbi:hypothetical protein KAFR_0D02860 [Kazachstania africana CBS 2517]|uniref:t-SNARE coiled-coil homology domain-containing protein n=1 Tax=Kazachstania africana (strain ATCC 22294 / BCRC 22015 / CBS 2517 / CECT 1963 / NBRC 1671 / NRRL Y-8276) TaxID=1071382 RepID=H2AU84_KAZAF|nr:hypothetical protein KAFR_0D02860 [Kazachstania africana CBS 2517]CCF57934.1 hypothetical protein KAFR_0D02860 [Kazachstania africana CBS 2517]